MEFAGKGDDLSDANAKGNTEVTVEVKTARLGMPTFLRTPANSDQGDGDAICYDCTPVSPHDNEKEKGPADKLVIPSHIVEIKEGETIVYIIGTRDGKVTKIEGLEIAKDTLEVIFIFSKQLNIIFITSLHMKIDCYSSLLFDFLNKWS